MPLSPAATSLDVTDLNCPLPILKARKALSTLPTGALLEVLATDPGSIEDFSAFCRATGHHLIEQTTAGRVHRFLIRKAAAGGG